MPIEIHMPGVGGNATEAGIARWLHAVGASVREGDVLVEIEADKAIVEVTAPEDGVLARIDVSDGKSGVAVGAVIGLLARAGEDAAALAAPAPASTRGAAAAATMAAATTAADAPRDLAAPSRGRVPASPLARRVARSLGVDLAAVRGSGPRGRVLRADVERAATAAPCGAPAPAAATPAAGAVAERIAHTGMRRAIAQRLAASKQTVPHFYLTIDCDVDALLALRTELARQAGFKPSLNDFCVKAAAAALRAVPAVNARWTDDAVERLRGADVCVAVATPGGLATPIVRDADRRSLREIGEEIRSLAARAREGRLRTHELEGGSFTVTNLGMHGVREFHAIVNPPQAAILAIGASEPRPVVRDGAVAVAVRMTCTLSADHRLIDGIVGAQFLAAWKRLVEAPLALLG